MTSLNGVRNRRLTATEITIASCEVLDEEYHIALQGIFSVGITDKCWWLKVTDWLFAFACCKK